MLRIFCDRCYQSIESGQEYFFIKGEQACIGVFKTEDEETSFNKSDLCSQCVTELSNWFNTL